MGRVGAIVDRGRCAAGSASHAFKRRAQTSGLASVRRTRDLGATGAADGGITEMNGEKNTRGTAAATGRQPSGPIEDRQATVFWNAT